MVCAPGWSGGWPWGGGLFPGLFFLALLGVGLWLLLRSRPASSLEQDFCPSCRGEIRSAYFRCPHCGGTLKSNCPSCSRVVEQAWEYCPFCSRELKKQRDGEAASAWNSTVKEGEKP